MNRQRYLSLILATIIVLIACQVAISTSAQQNSTATAGTPIPTNTRRPTVTLTPSIAVTTINTNVPGPLGGDLVTWTPMPTQRALFDHYVFERPIGQNDVNYWARNYSYGSTDSGSRPVHHGIDFQDPSGTAVLAAGDGTVYYAGNDTDQVFGPQPNFYGNVIVIQHPYRDVDGNNIYTLYGHLSKIDVLKGQKIKVGQEIGLVGSAGIAIGPHLHFEVRAGTPTEYNNVRNPELWIKSYLDYGVLTGRVMDLYGNELPGMTVEVQSAQVYRAGFSYADNSVGSDPVMNENFAIPDLPSGYYTVFVKQSGTLLFRTLVFIRAGHSTWINININP
jgi:murein DD-endopeptidase MepM/ murein hydrolase activator NlpD